MRLKGKHTIITGAASGIGRQTAYRFAEEGAAVICGDINIAGAEETARTITERGGRAKAIAVDIGSDDSVNAFIRDSISTLGHIDVLVNNAGMAILGKIEEISAKNWDKQIDINVTSIRRTSAAIWDHFVARGGGLILNTASIAGKTGTPNQIAYGTSKGAVIIMSKCMALDGARHKIRVNCVCPGLVDTPMAQIGFDAAEDPAAVRAAIEKMHLLGFGKPIHIANGFVFLASDEACWMTGTEIVIDGGLTAGLSQFLQG